MSLERWDRVDRYLVETMSPEDAALRDALEASRAAGLPAIQVTASQGRLLQILARAVGAKAILEIGTLGGYSTIWLARALPRGGRVVTLERDPHHAEVARSNLARAGVAGAVRLVVGEALEELPRLVASGAGPFDLVFVDADKPSLPEYLEWSLRLSRPGGLIVVDNVVREGEVADAASPDPAVQGVRRMFERIAAEPRVSATAVQTVGAKGHDGFALVFVER
jgi:predicted O-methyltransferase YrrM